MADDKLHANTQIGKKSQTQQQGLAKIEQASGIRM